MCGIAGYLGEKNLSRAAVENCLDLMGRRGPDSNGHFHSVSPSGNYIHLLHSRLSVLDLDERANQPFGDDRFKLVFNGEIYNYQQLKTHQSLHDWCPIGTGDTEVLFALLTRKWSSCFSSLEGMWGLAVYDCKTGSLLLSRDRFGEKPLYIYSESNGDIYFGSEPKFIFALRGQSVPINMDQVSRYLVNGYKSLHKGKDTFFKDLVSLPPGTHLTFDVNKQGVLKTYWTPNLKQNKYLDLSFDDAVSGVKQRLKKSVELRLQSDVPVAFCLSGGVDSNALAALAKKELGRDVTGFSIVNSDPRYSEYEFIKAAVSDLGIQHHEVEVRTSNFIDELKTLIAYHDAPVHTITYFAHWQLMRVISENGFKVSISGTGADELFSGYYDHHNFFLHELKSSGSDMFELALKNWEEHVSSIVRNPYLKDPLCFIKSPALREHIYLNADRFSDYMKHGFSECFYEEQYSDSILRNRMANELFHEIVPPILSMDDMNSMYYSVENRSPFLDTELFEWAYQIPTRHLIRNGRAKALLREAVRGVCCDSVIDNPRKVGFNAPIEDYLDLKNGDDKEFLMQDSPIFEFVYRDKIEEYLKKESFTNSESKFLFSFICAKIFMEGYGG